MSISTVKLYPYHNRPQHPYLPPAKKQTTSKVDSLKLSLKHARDEKSDWTKVTKPFRGQSSILQPIISPILSSSSSSSSSSRKTPSPPLISTPEPWTKELCDFSLSAIPVPPKPVGVFDTLDTFSREMIKIKAIPTFDGRIEALKKLLKSQGDNFVGTIQMENKKSPAGSS